MRASILVHVLYNISADAVDALPLWYQRCCCSYMSMYCMGNINVGIMLS